MNRAKTTLQRTPSHPPPTWRGLQARMTLSYIVVTLGTVLLVEIIHWISAPHPRLTWDPLLRLDIGILILVPLIGGLFGIISTHGLIARLRAMAEATTRFANGQYEQRLKTGAGDEIGQLEAHLNQMAEQLVAHLTRQKLLVEQNTRLEERARLSRDLHDSIKQQLFALAVQIELARSLLNQDSQAASQHLGFADDLSYQIQQELTALIHALRPADLRTKGLIAALRDYVTTWSLQSNIAADLALPQSCSLPPSIEEALWRVMQEALSNVARHSQASTVHIHLTQTEQHVSLSISDDGQGFAQASHEPVSLGLRSIRERIEQVGGTVLIQSEQSRGTHITVRCPLLPTSDDAQRTNEVTAS